MSKLVLTKVVNHTFVNENPLALIRPTNATTKKPFHQRDALFKTPQSSIISSMQYFFEQKLVAKKCHISTALRQMKTNTGITLVFTFAFTVF